MALKEEEIARLDRLGFICWILCADSEQEFLDDGEISDEQLFAADTRCSLVTVLWSSKQRC